MSWLEVARYLIDVEVILESTALGIGFCFSALFNYLYKKHKAVHEKVADATYVAIDKGLLEAVTKNAKDFQFVALCGKVQADSKLLQSRYFLEKKGVILNFTTEERKEIWAKYSHVWYESERELSNITETVPFSLTDGNGGSVHIMDPLNSEWCKSTLSITNKEFRDPNSSVMDSIVGLVTGDRIKGYTDTERMLQVDTRLLGIGELFVEDGILKLKKPSDCELILTTATHKEVISFLGRKVKFWRIFRLLALGAALGGLYYFLKSVRRKYSRVKNDLRTQKELEAVRRQRTLASNRRVTGNAAESNQDEKCIICLTNPRECVILNCGHVCACVDCIDILPAPKTCPMCRSPVVRIVPLFHA